MNISNDNDSTFDRFTVTIPTVAVGHVYTLLFFQASASSSSSLKTLFTSSDIASQQFASAVEAPLTVCETFSGFAVALFGLAAIMFKTGWGLPVEESNMVRPFCYNFDRVVISGIITTVVHDPSCHTSSLASTQGHRLFRSKVRGRFHLVSSRLSLILSTAKRWLDTAWPIISLPFMAVQTAIIILGAVSETKYMSTNQILALRLSLAIPKSAVCLFLAHVTLVFSLWDALKGSLRQRLAAHRARGEQANYEQ
ncbi:hypothetical protein QBC36DRAFT_346555 [Triangularia setosa]|uniref:Uncharacterized protein n=1 Tax=Triangularia setosa TaxID=2587417 RepID=A0AAN6W635_9PEZI|nr:hypothetical protein QBC36DRAFT_346555 [Podospora setosa]